MNGSELACAITATDADAIGGGAAAVDDDGASVSGTRCGVRLDIGGRIGLVGHWYSGVRAVGTLREKELQMTAMRKR